MHFSRTDGLPPAVERAAEAVYRSLVSAISDHPALGVAVIFAMCTCSSQHTDKETRGMFLGINDLELSFCCKSTVA